MPPARGHRLGSTKGFLPLEVNKTAASAQTFLKGLHKAFPIRINKLLTDVHRPPFFQQGVRAKRHAELDHLARTWA